MTYRSPTTLDQLTRMCSPLTIHEMREHVEDCYWADVEPEDFAELPDATIIRGIEQHYYGGVRGFIEDYTP